VPNFPRLRALALFGRRLVECAERLSLPASKNQHRLGRHAASAGGLPCLRQQTLRLEVLYSRIGANQRHLAVRRMRVAPLLEPNMTGGFTCILVNRCNRF
jgi:hypothetical protein